MRTTEFTDRWIAALRSGEYQQCQGVLRGYLGEDSDDGDDYGYCCLGVAADLMDELDESGCVWSDGMHDGESYETELSDRQRDMLGITGHEQDRLITANDEHKRTFAEIADAIERAKETGEIRFP